MTSRKPNEEVAPWLEKYEAAQQDMLPKVGRALEALEKIHASPAMEAFRRVEQMHEGLSNLRAPALLPSAASTLFDGLVRLQQTYPVLGTELVVAWDTIQRVQAWSESVSAVLGGIQNDFHHLLTEQGIRYQLRVEAFELAMAMREADKAQATQLINEAEFDIDFLGDVIAFAKYSPERAQKKLAHYRALLDREIDEKVHAYMSRVTDKIEKDFIAIVRKHQILVDWLDDLEAIDALSDIRELLAKVKVPALNDRWERRGEAPDPGSYLWGIERRTLSKWLRKAWTTFAPGAELKRGRRPVHQKI